MKNIITPEQIKESVVTVFCDKEQGTGFFVSKNMILTAFHTFMFWNADSSKIKIRLFNNEEVKGELFSKNEDFDIAIIKLESPIGKALPITSKTIRYNEKWESNGFPYSGEAETVRLEGNVNQIIIGQKSNFILESINIDKNFNYSGFSGAPVVLSNKVGGIILEQEDNKLLAISIYKIKEFLIENNIDVEDDINITDLPIEFENDIQTSTPNYENFNSIDNVIKSSKNWFLLSGSPGSGKTLSIATYLPDNEDIDIIGKYFVKIPNDKLPKAIRITKDNFLKWIEEIIFLTTTGYLPPIENLNFEERLRRIPTLFENLSIHYKTNNKIALLIIDGLDEITDIDTFINIIPINLQNNIKILLSCTSKEILPSQIKSIISENETIISKPINLGQCEAFIQKEIGNKKLNIETIQDIALKSEGHPLYLRYLVNYIKSLNDEEINEINDWLTKVPSIEGNISIYYDSIWDKINEIPDKLWVIIILSHIRQPIPQQDLFQILPKEYQHSFYIHYSKLRYLFNDSKFIELYHNSFKEYIISKTYLNKKQANDYISTFCKNNSENKYTINNHLHHLNLSSTPLEAINNCNQEWADNNVFKDVSPDLVLSDIKNIINSSIDLGETTELLRLLLLLQRIEFRYDTIFAENADLIAKVLISTGKYSSAINYLVRENTLLVNNDDAILFLQLFYENEAFEEANILFKSIEQRYRKSINEGISSSSLDLSSILMFLQAISLKMNEDFESSIQDFFSFQTFLKNIKNKALENGDKNFHDAIERVREYGIMWNNAYLLRRYDGHMDSSDITKENGSTLDEKWAGMRALSVVFYNEQNSYKAGVCEKSKKFHLLINDIEFLITKYDYVKEKNNIEVLIKALINDSLKSNIVEQLIKEFLIETKEINLREANGVDLNYQDIYNFYFIYKYKGYIDKEHILPSILNQYTRHKDWEKYSLSILESIAFIEGKAYRLKADNNLSDINDIYKSFNNIIDSINFTLEERSYWDRSYQLPEQLYPILYSKIIDFILTFKEQEIEEYLQKIIKYSDNQMGLYSEGFRTVINEIIKVLIIHNQPINYIIDLLEIWGNHVITGVENRHERTVELLKIIEICGLIEENDKIEFYFEEMLKTSMGPTWYKEDQLALINRTLGLIDSEKKYLKQFAGLLDYASGEMTFQRYVRNEKEHFIGDLIRNNKTNEALEYCKREIIPYPEIIIKNAESNTIDAPRLGDGYYLGARNIKEQNAIIEIIDNIDVKSKYLLWVLNDIFTINDDIFRHIQSFGNTQAELLKEFEINDNSNLSEMYQSVSDTAIKMDDTSDRKTYLDFFRKSISEKGLEKIQNNLLKLNYTWDIDFEENINRETKEPDIFDKFNSKNTSNKQREKHIENGINLFISEKMNFWLASSWSTSTNNTLNKLKSLFKNDIEVIQHTKKQINSFSVPAWVITNKLIWLLDDKLSDKQVSNTFKIINEHFNLLIRPQSNIFEKYDWMDNVGSHLQNDQLLLKFIIWFLDHPIQEISDRTYNSLLTLAIYEPELIIPILFEELFIEEPVETSIKCSLILKDISNTNPEMISNFLSKEKKQITLLKNIKHFTIKKHLLDISIKLNSINSKELYKELMNTIPTATVLTGDIFLDDKYLSPIIDKIESLNDMSILNREFCESLLSNIKTMCNPLSITDFLKSDKYLRRSFPKNENFYGRFDRILNYSLNIAITPRINKDNINEVYEIINSK